MKAMSKAQKKVGKVMGEYKAGKLHSGGTGKIAIEGKDEIKRRGLPSPDKADAFVLTFASDAVMGMYGSSGSSKWSQPLRRNLVRVA